MRAVDTFCAIVVASAAVVSAAPVAKADIQLESRNAGPVATPDAGQIAVQKTKEAVADAHPEAISVPVNDLVEEVAEENTTSSKILRKRRGGWGFVPNCTIS